MVNRKKFSWMSCKLETIPLTDWTYLFAVADKKLVRNLTRSIIKNYRKNEPTTKSQMNELVNTMNDVLEAPSQAFKKSDQKSLNETISVIENSLENYNFETVNQLLIY